MPFATSILNSIVDHWTGKATWTAPAAVYIGLSSTTPTGSGGSVTEPSGGSYARVLISPSDFSSASGGAGTTVNDILFVRATADWVSAANLTYAVFYTAVSGGTFIGYAALTVPKPVLSGDQAQILAGDFDIVIT
jgi:hypothetical protein